MRVEVVVVVALSQCGVEALFLMTKFLPLLGYSYATGRIRRSAF